jgi:ribonuclease HII
MALKRIHTKGRLEAGCDEAGRGCLAGPVVAAAVILPKRLNRDLRNGLNDSKKLSEKQRMHLAPIIKEKSMAYGIGFVSHEEIDQMNILNASFEAMHRAVRQLKVTPEWLLIDGNRFNPFEGIPHTCVIKGDGKFLSIAAASILAKTARDLFMEEQGEKWPNYGWERNKGYPTKAHRKAIAEYGASPIHRKSFKLLPDEQLTIFD